jgi:hypothetical protein
VPRTQLWGFERGRATAELSSEVTKALRMTIQVGAMRSFDLRAGLWVKSGGAVAWGTQRGSELRRGRLRSDQTGERLFGAVSEVLIMRCRFGSLPEVSSGDAWAVAQQRRAR